MADPELREPAELGRLAELEDLAERVLAAEVEEAGDPLQRMGFRDPAGTSRVLDRLAGPLDNLSPLPASVLAAAATLPLPDRALRNLERFVESAGTRDSLFRRLRESEPLCHGVLTVLGHSRFLTDILIRNPEYLFWLFEETPGLRVPLSKRALRSELDRELEHLADAGDRLRALRRIHRRELLRIGAGDVLGFKEVAQIGRELSDLADVVLEAALVAAYDGLVRVHGHPCGPRGSRAHFIVVSLGKLGGRELNFSSDIDLMFVYDDDGHTRGRRIAEIDNSAFFNRLGERLIQILTDVTEDGIMYRVDMRLRPEGELAPLARSVRNHWIYYEMRGALWERQMLIKARRAAGSYKLWRRFQQMLVPFVYPAHFTMKPQEEIRRIKQRIEAEIQDRPERGNNIKLQPGGIRDVEFTVQCLQMLSGRVDESARCISTLPAIAALENTGALEPSEADDLRRAYCFLRRLENLLQIAEGRAIYAVPDADDERRGLAAFFGLDSAEKFDRLLAHHVGRVQAIYTAVLFDDAEEDALEWLLTDAEGSPRVHSALGKLGFTEVGIWRHRWP